MKARWLKVNQWRNSRQTLMKSLVSFLLFCLAGLFLFIVGLVIGYGFIGSGEPFAILKQETWANLMTYFK
ncbi:DNA-directed RNA polymerase subunit beta [Atopobacter sp. AH10]|uniref:DNA-directed RNA polymerase subunit beta n=1 Tax=Atopobacter sp. AH10 TaxID=2315861 RepID=UPI000EF20019|nr:DNA-directed RNA polymerase subunit beta [Atopobacter sp. AH10]RLK64088.1 DNA-directed RNA polymerase subunit beta [Atopobacter sp. AH10]